MATFNPYKKTKAAAAKKKKKKKEGEKEKDKSKGLMKVGLNDAKLEFLVSRP